MSENSDYYIEYVGSRADAINHTRELLWLEHCLERGLAPGHRAKAALVWALDVIQENLDIDVLSLGWDNDREA